MATRLVALDLDGTLLNNQKEIEEPVLARIKQLSGDEVHFVIVTGRMYCSAVRYARQVGQVLPLTCLNGTMIKDVATDETLYHNPLRPELARVVVERVNELPVHTFLYDNDCLLLRSVPDELREYFGRTSVRFEMTEDLVGRVTGQISQVMLAGQDSLIQEARRQLEEENGHRLEFFFYPSRMLSSFAYLEIKNPGDSKGCGLRMLREMLGVSREEVMAIGDYDNDLSLFEESGLRIAMQNASEALKARADRVTTRTNDEGGVLEALDFAFSR
ncbi:MAG: HAD family phosphatase [Deltaproteobacteria bacterium]|nr:HAD family phosphatase [Deltaproteobacteria bacterium]